VDREEGRKGREADMESVGGSLREERGREIGGGDGRIGCREPLLYKVGAALYRLD